jgi:hypothetical protein
LPYRKLEEGARGDSPRTRVGSAIALSKLLFRAALLVARQYDEALRQFRQTLEVFPDYSDVYQLLGMTYLFKVCLRKPLRPG